MHRDFKADNIFIKDGVCKIGDFGFSKQVIQTTNTFLGTPLTMAPEVLGQKDYDNRADLWSLGVVYYNMLEGQLPFTANNEMQLLNAMKKNNI